MGNGLSMTARHEITRKFALAYAGASKVAQFECVTNGRMCTRLIAGSVPMGGLDHRTGPASVPV